MNYLIIGASSDTALAFIQQHGWNKNDRLICTYNQHKETLEEKLQSIPAVPSIHQVDFLSEQNISEFIENLKEFTPDYILHTPAIPISNNRFTELSWDMFNSQFIVQVKSFYLILQSVIQKMAKAKFGRIIVLLSSCTLNVPPSYLSSYVTAKYALMGLTKALAAEYASKNIFFNMISPSMMNTKFLENIYDSVIDESAYDNPLHRNAAPEDIAKIISFFFTNNNFITGTNIPVTGGETF